MVFFGALMSIMMLVLASVGDGTRKKRARPMKLNLSAVITLLKPLAKKRTEKFRWDASDYSKKRGCSGDVEHLALVADILLILARAAPNGYPCHIDMRAILIKLDVDHNIFGLDDDSRRFTEANTAADVWRVMLKHCLALKKTGRPVADPILEHVIDTLREDEDLNNDGDEEDDNGVGGEVELNDEGWAVLDAGGVVGDLDGEPIDVDAGGQNIDGEVGNEPTKDNEPEKEEKEGEPEKEDEPRKVDDDDVKILGIRCGCANCRGPEEEVPTDVDEKAFADAVAASIADEDVYWPGSSALVAASAGDIRLDNWEQQQTDEAIAASLAEAMAAGGNLASQPSFADAVENTKAAPPRRGAQKKVTLARREELNDEKKEEKAHKKRELEEKKEEKAKKRRELEEEKAQKAAEKEKEQVRRRLTSKQTLKAKPITKEAHSKPRGCDFTLEFPLKVESKKGCDTKGRKHKAHSVIIDTYKRHVVGCSEGVCCGHREVLASVASEAKAQGLTTRKEIAEIVAVRVADYNASHRVIPDPAADSSIGCTAATQTPP